MGAVVPPLGALAYWLQTFLQLRGFVNLLASRIDIALICVCAFVAQISGYNRSTTPTVGYTRVLAGLKVSALLPSSDEEEKQLFEDKSLWANETFIKAGGIYSQEPFKFTKRGESLTLLDIQRD